MLQYLKIKKFTLIDNAEISFKKGMTTITGQTGAGKSILINALYLALGLRIDSAMVNSAAKCEISAIFIIEGLPQAQLFLQQNGLPCDSTCIVRRVIYKDGKNRVFINDTPVTLAKLKLLGQCLVSFYGQHDHYSLLDINKQLELVDTYGGLSNDTDAIKKTYDAIKALEKNIESETHRLIQKNTEISLLQYQYTELNELQITENEFDELDKKHRQLSTAEHKHAILHQISDRIYSNDDSLIGAIELLGNSTDQNDDCFQNISQLLEQAKIYLQEAHQEAKNVLHDTEINPEKMAIIEQRLSNLHNIARKHQISPNDLFNHLFNIQKVLAQFQSDDQALERLKSQKESLVNSYQQKALALRQKRQTYAKKFASEVKRYLQRLNIPEGEFSIHLIPLDKMTANGIDRCEFTMTFNKGQQAATLKKVASGGELSRIALAVHVITSQKIALPTIVFDEVDVGISGSTAEIVGQMLKQLSKKTQILCITHQAQVAIQGDQQLHVYKKNIKDKTISSVSELSSEERIKAIAQIIAGIKITDKALIHAREMYASIHTIPSPPHHSLS